MVYAGEEHMIPERMAEIIAENLVAHEGSDDARTLAKKIETALVEPSLRAVNITTVEAATLCEVLGKMNPPEGFPDTPFRRLRAAACRDAPTP